MAKLDTTLTCFCGGERFELIGASMYETMAGAELVPMEKVAEIRFTCLACRALNVVRARNDVPHLWPCEDYGAVQIEQRNQ